MVNIRRKFLRSMLSLSGTIGAFKSISVARACGATYDGPVTRPITHQLDFSHSHLTEYLIEFYGSKLPIKQNTSLNIETEEHAQNSSVVPTQIEIPIEYFENNFKNMECSRIDVFSQVMDSILEGPIYRIASYTFSNNSLPNIGLRYRRDFTYSRVIAVATLIDKTSKRKTEFIYNYTNTVRGGGPCNLTLPGY